MADRYEVMEANRDGTGYVVFFFDNDSDTCGQQFHGAPVHNKAAFGEHMLELMSSAKVRHRSGGAPEVAAEIVAEVQSNKARAESVKDAGVLDNPQIKQ